MYVQFDSSNIFFNIRWVERNVEHRALHGLTHSLPTRRSSDLKAFAVFFGEAVGGAVCRCGFEVVEVAGLLLITDEAPAHMIENGQRHFDAEIGRAPSELQSLMRRSYPVFCMQKKSA